MAVPVFMIISGYVSTLSMDYNGIISLESAYNCKTILGKFLRYTIPFIVAFAIDVLFRLVIQKADLYFFDTVKLFLYGGNGPGSYYYPVMVQFIFVFPIIYFLIKRHEIKGLLICFIANALFEVLKWAYQMNDECYRLLLFRYIFLIGFGCFFALYPKAFKVRDYVISLIVGIGFIYIVEYTNYQPVILTQWTRTSFVAALYIIPIFAFALSKLNIKLKPIELLGKASYNIYLTQMVYYTLGTRYVYPYIMRRGWQLLASVIICLAVGTVFYLLENPFTIMIKKKLLR